MQRRKFLRGGLLGLGGLMASRGLKGQTPNEDFKRHAIGGFGYSGNERLNNMDIDSIFSASTS